MNKNFTPSIWRISDDVQILSPCIDGTVSLVATVNGHSDEARRNARLIANAPGMYYILRNLLFELKRGNWSNPEYVRESRILLEDLVKELNEEDSNV